MTDALDPFAVARKPTQQRAKERFDRILEEAEKLLLEEGLGGFSIPTLAERLEYTRGSVYAYFPTPFAILNELAGRYLAALEQEFFSRAEELRRLNWRDATRMVVQQAVKFHNSHPVARLLILGGAVTHEGYRAQEITIKRLGDLGRGIWSAKGVQLPKGPPDITTLAAEVATACFRRSYFDHGEITPAYRDAAVHGMIAFLEQYVKEPATAQQDARPATKPKIARRRSA